MKTKNCILCALLVMMVGCAHNTVINVDGMPISNHEYTQTEPETKVRLSYVLTRYFKQLENKNEYLVIPEYLDAWDAPEVSADDDAQLILHLKIVNLRRIKYTVWYELEAGNSKAHLILYSGQLSRKDIPVLLPLDQGPKVKYRITLVSSGVTIHEIGFPYFSYSVKGGVKTLTNTQTRTR